MVDNLSDVERLKIKQPQMKKLSNAYTFLQQQHIEIKKEPVRLLSIMVNQQNFKNAGKLLLFRATSCLTEPMANARNF